ncbi:MAG: hypothetical protein ACOH5I_17180 [Oligoflexus sp.]
MNLLPRIWNKLLFLLLCLSPLPGIAGDITVLDSLGFQGASDIVGAKTYESSWHMEALFDQQQHIELQPEQNGSFHGKRQRLGFNVGTGIWDSADFSIGLRHINESLARPASFIGAKTDHSASQFSLAIRQNILKLKHMQWAAIPYIEPAFGPQDSFGLRSKTRIGGIFAIDANYRFVEFSSNIGFRHRPVEYYGIYRISNEYHFGGRLGVNLHPLFLHAELHEKNSFVLSSMTRKPAYQRQVSQYHKIVASVDFDEFRGSLFWGRAVAGKTFGVPSKQIGFAIAWNVGADRSVPTQEMDRQQQTPPITEDEALPPLETPEELPSSPEESDALDPLPVEPNQEESIMPEESPTPEINPELPDSERLDRLEEHLLRMRLVEESSPLQTLHEREVMEQRLGEEEIQRLRRTEEKMGEKKSLDRIRQSIHKRQDQSTTGASSNEGLLEQLDEKLDKKAETKD